MGLAELSWELIPTMRRSLRWCIACGAMLGLAIEAAGTAKANLVVNGDFGTGDLTGWSLSGDTSSVYVSGSPGAYAAALTTSGLGDGFLTQSLSTTAGQEYLFSFLLAGDGATPNSLVVSLGGTTLVSLTDVPNTLASPVSYSYDFTASSSSSLLQFDFVDLPGYLYVTNVSANAVPEPSTVVSAGLAALILFGFACCKRRRSNKAESP
jgi:hypothetical protein